MRWLVLDANFTQHPKVVSLSAPELALFVGGLCYCSRNLTDGFIPTVAVSQLVSARTVRYSRSAADALVARRLWDEAPGGYRVHDYLDYQRSRAFFEARGRGAHRERTGSAPREDGERPDTINTRARGQNRTEEEKRTLTPQERVNSNGSDSTEPGLPFSNTRVETAFDPSKREFFENLATRLADADSITPSVLHTFARRGLPEAAFRTAMESLVSRRSSPDKPGLVSESRYFVSALKRMEDEGQYER